MDPIITEKSTSLYQNHRICTFSVGLGLNKYQIADAFKAAYSLEANEVNIVNRLGKYKRHRKNYRKFTLVGNKKIAYIKIDKNAKLDLFEIK